MSHVPGVESIARPVKPQQDVHYVSNYISKILRAKDFLIFCCSGNQYFSARDTEPTSEVNLNVNVEVHSLISMHVLCSADSLTPMPQGCSQLC